MARRKWDQQPKESNQAYEAFCVYLNTPKPRTKEPVYSSLSKCRQLISRWANNWDWEDRVLEYDRYVQRQRDLAAADYARTMEERRLKQVEDAWNHGEMLVKKALAMLEYPHAVKESKTTTSEDGKTITTITLIKPAKWFFRDVALILKMAADLKAAAVNAGSGDTEHLSDAEINATAALLGGAEDPPED